MGTAALQAGHIVAEGKTKVIVRQGDNAGMVNVLAKDDITAGDGAKHHVMKGKAELATKTTCNVFRFLQRCGIPVAFGKQFSEKGFSAPLCRMLPYEVVVRREAHGSFLKRMPMLTKGHLFPRLKCEFFLKTKDKRWKEHELQCDDPLMGFNYSGDQIRLFVPSKPIHGQEPFLVLNTSEVFIQPSEAELFEQMEKIATRTFLLLEKAWQLLNRRLVDFKVEFGVTDDGRLLLSDVIDNDSWRLVSDGAYEDKQVYRDGGSLDKVLENYRRVAELTDQFCLPRQQIVIWRGSDKDDAGAFTSAFVNLCGDFLSALSSCVVIVGATRSMHKEAVRGVLELQDLVQSVPDSVVLAYIGRSNGAGPTLSSQTHVPVLTVPAGYKEFSDDVWSSLRTPSDVPVGTVLEPANAILLAMQILSARNPIFYAILRERIEKRLLNVVEI